MRHLIGVEPRHVLDHRRLDGGGIVALVENRTGEQCRIGLSIARRAPFLGDDLGGVEATASGDDLIAIGRAVRADDDRLDDATAAHGRQDIGHVRRLFAIAHIGLAHDQLVERDKIEFHCRHSL